MLDEDNRLKIIDFGLALRIPQGPDGRARALPPQGLCGKISYMSPEVSINSGDFDGFAVDAWACGIMLFMSVAPVEAHSAVFYFSSFHS